MDNQTLFIVGCARTGSSLLRQILNKHERLCLAAETHFLRRWSSVGREKQLLEFGDLSDEANVGRLVDCLYSAKRMPNNGYWKWLKNTVDPQIFKRRILDTDRSDQAIFTTMLELFAESKKGAYNSELILGEKTPTHLYYVPTLFEWFPKTKIIHTFRDPRGIFVSTVKRMHTHEWGLKRRYPQIPDGLLKPLISPVTTLYTTMNWFDAVRLHSLYQQRYGARYLLIRFEDLIGDPTRTVQQICDFLGVRFDPGMVEEVAVMSSSHHAQNRGPSGFDKQNISRWQAHIDPFNRAWFSLLGRKHLKTFEYIP